MNYLEQEYIKNLAKPTQEMPHFEAQAYTQSRLDEQWDFWCRDGRANSRQPILASALPALQTYINAGLTKEQIENWLREPQYQYTLVWDVPFEVYQQRRQPAAEDEYMAMIIYQREHNFF